MSVMCNLSQGIVDDAKAEIILNMFKKGYTLEQIADVTEKSISEIEKIAAFLKSIRFSLLYRYINRITNESVTILDKCSFYGFSCDIIKNACIKCLSRLPIWIG